MFSLLNHFTQSKPVSRFTNSTLRLLLSSSFQAQKFYNLNTITHAYSSSTAASPREFKKAK
ncbi:hypothetical protein PVK06_001160 [Gossypium arboreum]|uniref:Uncharacterized protein n=1 Tax=Gossypium arboreum TaxID=29729 RepID=A0ABR0R0F2_GOSAR|nr:hypothetical protein PVK06_001160 [Gossypium arboreum]